MPTTARAPNRVLDLDELESPAFRDVLSRLDARVARDDVSYLHPGKRWEYPWALERAELAPGSRILDMGRGDSIFPVYLASLERDVTAADLEFTTDLGALHGVPTTYVRADMAALPMEDGSFDAVFCISVIENLTTDVYEDASAELWYGGPGMDPFRVDRGFFDEALVRA